MAIIDAHVHYEDRILDDAGLLGRMDRAGISRAVLIPHLTDPPETKKSDFPMMVQRYMLYRPILRPLAVAITKSMYRKSGEWNMWHRKGSDEPSKFRIVTEPDNGRIAAAISRHPERFLGWIFVNPSRPDAINEIEKWRGVRGMVGVKIHPFWHRFPLEQAGAVAARAEELGLPLLVHLGFDEAGAYQWLIERFPRLNIILAHLGIPYYRDAWQAALDRKNVYFDLSSTYHVEEGFVRDAYKALGPERLIFGTDAPYAHDDSIERILRWVDRLMPGDRERELILSGNFMRIAKIS